MLSAVRVQKIHSYQHEIKSRYSKYLLHIVEFYHTSTLFVPFNQVLISVPLTHAQQGQLGL